VYVVGLPLSMTNEKQLMSADYFGQYGRITKLVVDQNNAAYIAVKVNKINIYITFHHKDDAKACIQALDGFRFDNSHILHATYGTAKYCNFFIMGKLCKNPDCVFVHEVGDDNDRFIKDELQPFNVDMIVSRNPNQVISYGRGGPSGTGKIPSSSSSSSSLVCFPPPVVLIDQPKEDHHHHHHKDDDL